MNRFTQKKTLFFAYIFFVVYGLAVYFFSRYFALTPWFLMLSFVFVIFLPGFSLARIFKIEFKNDDLGQVLLWLTLGLTFNFFLCFLAMALKLTLPQLIYLYLTLMVVLPVLGAVLDFFRPVPELAQKEKFSFKKILKKIFNRNNWIYLALFVFLALILITIDEQGTNFKGDPYFHLVIMRKIAEGFSLSPENLNFIKTAQIHPAYGFPVWHTFMTMLGTLINSNIFTVFAEITLSLSLMVIAVWYWLMGRLFPNKVIQVLALMLFVVFTYRYQDGYFFTRLPVPDTLCQLLILPLIFAMALKYIFDRTVSYKVLLTFSLLSLLMAAIHFTQYVYFQITMVVFALGYSLIKFKDPEFKETLKRILWAICTSLLIVLPFLVLLELHGHVVSNTIKQFWSVDPNKMKLGYRPFKGVEILAKYAYIATPLVFLFVKKYRQLVFVFTLFLVMPLAYSQTIGFIKYYLIKLVGFICMNRLYSNVTWDYVVWALFLGFGLILLDRLVGFSKRYWTNWPTLINLLLAGLLGALIALEIKFATISNFYKKTIISQPVIDWLNKYYYWVILGLIIITLGILIWQRYSKKVTDFFDLGEPKHQLTAAIMVLIFTFFFFSPNLKSALNLIKLEFTEKYFFITAKDHITAVLDVNSIGGQEPIDFIRQNVPNKSVFLTDSASIKILPMLVDQYMAAYPRTKEEKEYRRLFQSGLSLEDELKYLSSSGINYVFMTLANSSTQAAFDKYPQYFSKVYSDKAIIYKVDANKAKLDYQLILEKKNQT